MLSIVTVRCHVSGVKPSCLCAEGLASTSEFFWFTCISPSLFFCKRKKTAFHLVILQAPRCKFQYLAKTALLYHFNGSTSNQLLHNCYEAALLWSSARTDLVLYYERAQKRKFIKVQKSLHCTHWRHFLF